MKRHMAVALILLMTMLILTSCGRGESLYRTASSVELSGSQAGTEPVTEDVDSAKGNDDSQDIVSSANGQGEQTDGMTPDSSGADMDYSAATEEIIALLDSYGEVSSSESGYEILQAFEDDIESFLDAMVATREVNYDYYKQAVVWLGDIIARKITLDGETRYTELITAAKELPLSESSMEMLEIVEGHVEYWINYG